MNYRILLSAALICISGGLYAKGPVQPSHGAPYPDGWQNWVTIAMSHRSDNNTVRVILGNDIAVQVARANNLTVTNTINRSTLIG